LGNLSFYSSLKERLLKVNVPVEEVVQEAERILDGKGRFRIIPPYLENIHFVATSPCCDQSKVEIEPEAKRVWRDDEYMER
jgi:hypothetical protein